MKITHKSTKKKIVILIAAMLLIATAFGALYSSAAAYITYTYTINGDWQKSPDAYVPSGTVINSETLGLSPGLSRPTDLFADNLNNLIYIADPENSRVVVLNHYYKKEAVITTFMSANGTEDRLEKPTGIFVKTFNVGTDKMYTRIYVADARDSMPRIVIFKEDYTLDRVLDKPNDDLFSSSSVYHPVALAVDDAGKIYVISDTTVEGIIVLSPDGTLAALIGAQKTVFTTIQKFRRYFMSREQLEQMPAVRSTEYNNVTIDKRGMLYATISDYGDSEQESAMSGKSKSGDYAPVHRFNTQGNDIMQRNGFYPPSGEVTGRTFYTMSNSFAPTGPSRIVDVALGPEGTWSIVDQKRSRIFTYDIDGKLLFAFGDTGDQLGNLGQLQPNNGNKDVTAIEYFGSELLVMDGGSSANAIIVYRRTEYGDNLIRAIKNTNDLNYEEARKDWQEILKQNINYDAAYIGMGKSYYNEGKWAEAQKNFKTASDVANYSRAFGQARKAWVSAAWWHPVLILVVVAIIVVGVFFAFKYINKFNAKVTLSPHSRKGWAAFGAEIAYAFHVMFHPFDGFWDLKHEKRGSLRGAIFWVFMVIIAFSYRAIGTSYVIAGATNYVSVISQTVGVFVVILLISGANWCLTTLFDGEGKFRDIFIAIAYSAVPFVLLYIPATVLSHVLTADEKGFISLLVYVAVAWVALLAFLGIMVTHDYPIMKNVITIAFTVVGMMVIVFVVMLFSELVVKMVSFINQIVVELSFRT